LHFYRGPDLYDDDDDDDDDDEDDNEKKGENSDANNQPSTSSGNGAQPQRKPKTPQQVREKSIFNNWKDKIDCLVDRQTD
jgi:hypothetical protein